MVSKLPRAAGVPRDFKQGQAQGETLFLQTMLTALRVYVSVSYSKVRQSAQVEAQTASRP